MMLGYADPAAESSRRMTKQGFFLDRGHRSRARQDNAILITDRKKDIIIRGGENISAKEVEDVLHDHPGVHEAAVVAMPHKRLGRAFVLL